MDAFVTHSHTSGNKNNHDLLNLAPGGGGGGGSYENYSDEPTNMNAMQQPDIQNAKELLVDTHFYNNFGNIFYEDKLKDVMNEVIEARKEKLQNEASTKK